MINLDGSNASCLKVSSALPLRRCTSSTRELDDRVRVRLGCFAHLLYSKASATNLSYLLLFPTAGGAFL